MYAVIMAGGGGTRLHPLSRSERPKPFLPLLGPETLLKATARRLGRLTDDITVITDRRYRGARPRPGAERGGAPRADGSQYRRRDRPRDHRRGPTG
ncbi:MAG: sugar phosphate nucleotidyltransferase [Candidatus Limnocylindrales bacterium]